MNFPGDIVGPQARAAIAAMPPGGLVMLENLRFDEAETSKDDMARGYFADRLAAPVDLYVADGFGAIHRKHASVYDVPLRCVSAVGYLVQAEVAALRQLTGDIQRPYVVVLGGAKVADKFDAFGNLISKADRILVGGAMAFPFLAARGLKTGTSLLEAGQVDAAARYLEMAAPGQIELPSDLVVATEIAADAPRRVVAADAIPADQMGLDIGPESAARFAARDRDGRNGLLERSHGRVRAGPVRRRHPGRGPGHGGQRRVHRGGRRRHRRGHPRARLRRRRVRPRLHRRRRQP